MNTASNEGETFVLFRLTGVGVVQFVGFMGAYRDPEEVGIWSDQLSKGVTTIVYCMHGHQVSQGVAEQLHLQGFDARFLEGGIEAWKATGSETHSRT